MTKTQAAIRLAEDAVLFLDTIPESASEFRLAVEAYKSAGDGHSDIRGSLARFHLTKRQVDVAIFVHDYIELHGYSPTLNEIAAELDVSKITAHEHLDALVHRGVMIRLAKFKSRNIGFAEGVL